VTSLGLTVALVLLALLVARVGRGWWLLAVAALPLVPTELSPGVWAPPLSNQVAYAIVWPAGATEAQSTWAWVSAGITAVLVALPAATLVAMRNRRPWLSPGQVLGRLAPVGLVAAAWLGWRAYNEVPADVLLAGWRTILVIVGALAMTGLVRRGQVLLVLAVLPALAAGVVRWTTSVDGVPQLVVDPAAWWMSAVAVAGGVFAAYLQPRLAYALRSGWWLWRGALHARPDDARNEVPRESPDLVEADAWPRIDDLQLISALIPDDLSGLVPDEPVEVVRIVGIDEAEERAEVAVSRRRGRGASGRSAGRHRASPE
jgi:hypothetical protein